MSKLVKQPAPGIYRSKVHHVQKGLDELSTVALQMRLNRSVRWACSSMVKALEDYPPGLYSNSARDHKAGLYYADYCVSRVLSMLYNESVIVMFDWFYYEQIEGFLSEALETLAGIVEEAEANAPYYPRKGGPQPQRLKPLPIARKSP